jgi:hypothetical protein
MSLLEAAREDVASAVRQQTEVKMFNEGLVKGEQGIANKQRSAMQYRAEMRRAEAYGAELGSCGSQVIQKTFVPVRGRHRPPQKRRKIIKSTIMTNQVRRKRRQNELDGTHVNSGTSLLKQNDNHAAIPPAHGKTTLHKCKPFHVVLFAKVRNVNKCYGCNFAFKEINKKNLTT